jgi:hypothetical protein
MRPVKLLLITLFLILVIVTLSPTHAQTGLQIKLKNRSFEPRSSESITLDQLSGPGRHHIILQFITVPDHQTLEKFDIQPLNYIPDNGILASVPTDFDWQSLPQINWVGQLTAGDKISKNVTDTIANASPGSLFTFVVEAHPDVPAGTLAQISAAAGGEFEIHPDLPGYVGLVTGTEDVFTKLVQDEKIAWISAASDSLLNKEPVYYCPGPMTEYGPIANYTLVGDGWDGPGLGPASLTYHFVNGTPDIAGSGEEDAFRDALAEWATYADLTFTETGSSGLSNSFDVLWGAGDHGDPYPFDGPSGVLAHAFYPSPPNSEPIAGDLHFDEDETWSLTSNIHMFTVALHEAGHSLGLGHSDVSGAVMYAYYGGAVSGLEADDIAGIRALYSDGGGSCDDSFEDDDSSGQANNINDGDQQTHSICPSGDEDWVKFTLAAESAVQIETSGPSGDTTMSLYDSGISELEFNDDGGAGLFSLIDRTCGVDALPAGNYYVKIAEFGNNNVISSYDVSFDITESCTTPSPPPPPLNVQASDGTYDDKVRITWDSVAEATSYEIYRATSSGGSKSKLGEISGTSFDDTSASPGTTYFYWAKACNGSGCSTEYSTYNTGWRALACFLLSRSHTGSGTNPVATPTNSSGCSAGQYHAGETVSLAASPSSGWRVGSWSGTDNNSSTSTSNGLTMPNGQHTVTVNYELIPDQCYNLTLAHTGSGSSPVATPTNSSGCSSGQYHAGESISLTATPSSGWRVGSWSGTDNNSSTAAANTVTMPTGAHTAGVNYERIPFPDEKTNFLPLIIGP